MLRGEEARSSEEVMCARAPAAGAATRAPRQRRQKVITDIKHAACNYLSQQIIKGADNEGINISIVEMLYYLLGPQQRRL